MTDNVQHNILIAPGGQACLGDFGMTGAFPRFRFSDYGSRSLRYMAPEWFFRESPGDLGTSRPSKESDIHSLAMTSFSVCFSVVNHPAILHDLPVMTRSSQGYCRMVTVVAPEFTRIF